MNPHHKKASGKVCGCREEEDLSSSLATNYWTNYLLMKILLTQLQGWENTSGGGSEPETSWVFALTWRGLLEGHLIQSSWPKQGQLQAGQHMKTLQPLWTTCAVFDCPLSNIFSCEISCVLVWPLVLLWASLGRPWLPLLPPSHEVFIYIDEILLSLL